MLNSKIINLLSNEPRREDAFEGQAHRNIAEQVARIIKEGSNCHIIGIEGGWGSGKSNLICIVNKVINGQDVYNADFDHESVAYPFFEYDAWGHQSDFQRRAILEELICELVNEKRILKGKKWSDKLDELFSKHRKTITKEIPHLGVGTVVGIILCCITPLLVYLVGLIPNEKWWLKLLVSIVPYILGFVFAIVDRCVSLGRNGQKKTISNIASELFLVYNNQIKENETYTTISEKEPSSIEFRDWMEDINKDFEKEGKTLVIVFDNMDRLPSQKVEELWSSIHLFFSDKTYSNIKVLVPFDRAHIQHAFMGEDKDEESYGNDFINKTFDVVFRVPPPIMTSWQRFMAEKWKEAFGQDAVLDISVIQIYDALSKNHTPRKIIAFINDVATMKMTMKDNIPDRYLALYFFGKEKIEKNPVGQLLNPDYMGDMKFEYKNDPEAVKYISALYYQLPVDKALDVVFTKEVADALNSGDAGKLGEIVERIDISSILGKAILKVTDVEKAVFALTSLDNYYECSDFVDMPEWLVEIWDNLYHKCIDMNVAWNEIKDFHVPLFTHLFDKSLAEKLISGYLSIDEEKWDAKLYVETIDKLKVDNDIIDICFRKNKRKVSPKLFLEVLKYTKEEYKNYGILFDKAELDVYLAGLGINEILSLSSIPYIGIEKGDFPKYECKLKEWIDVCNGYDKNEMKILVERLKEVTGENIGL